MNDMMNDKILEKALHCLRVIEDERSGCQPDADIGEVYWSECRDIERALALAIDQLRWRHVSEELPTERKLYQVATEHQGKKYPDYADWCFDGKWDGIPPDKTLIKWWRPITLPEGE